MSKPDNEITWIAVKPGLTITLISLSVIGLFALSVFAYYGLRYL